ncbi:hypothetical protein, partial [uncultured Clostridium sp.]|uniref:hypothetical protein n=1 Tax=uncultured Clostridium sp. TaxID=59620 RepID=UPI0025D28B6D
MKYTINKRMITELANKGCKKNVINQMYEKSEGMDANYFTNKLNIKIPFQDKPPLARLTKEGELAELFKIEELSYRSRVLSQYRNNVIENAKNKYNEFKSVIDEHEVIVFTPANRNELKRRIKTDTIESKDFIIDCSNIVDKDIIKDNFSKIANKKNCDYLYQ